MMNLEDLQNKVENLEILVSKEVKANSLVIETLIETLEVMQNRVDALQTLIEEKQESA